mmetsp:Transcript_13160/g.26233  ORF Transcript_13160/g.26233 Transcript_13160/m.26233 type:complete len:202 (+) Transcript_13160:742-1347(+)
MHNPQILHQIIQLLHIKGVIIHSIRSKRCLFILLLLSLFLVFISLYFLILLHGLTLILLLILLFFWLNLSCWNKRILLQPCFRIQLSNQSFRRLKIHILCPSIIRHRKRHSKILWLSIIRQIHIIPYIHIRIRPQRNLPSRRNTFLRHKPSRCLDTILLLLHTHFDLSRIIPLPERWIILLPLKLRLRLISIKISQISIIF